LFNTEKDDVDEFFKWLLAGIIGAAIGARTDNTAKTKQQAKLVRIGSSR